MWIQGNFLVWIQGPLGIVDIDWGKNVWRGWVDTSVWGVILILVCFFHKQIYKIALPAIIALFSIQLVYLAIISIEKPKMWKSHWKLPHAIFPPEKSFQFSSKQNVIHVILDELQSTVFQEIIDKDPERYYDALEGFTFFKETTGSFPTTLMSIPALLSGQIYKNHIPIRSFQDSVYKGNTITNVLYDNGYEVDSISPFDWLGKGKGSTFYQIPVPYGLSKEQHEYINADLMLNLTLFRYAPYLLKKPIYNNGIWLPTTIKNLSKGDRLHRSGARSFAHKEFLQDLIDNMSVSRSAPVYKFIHLLTTHYPAVLNQDCQYAGKVLPWTWKNIRIQAKCSFDQFLEFLNKLKSLGIYKSSFIILHADHGYWKIPHSGDQVNLKNSLRPLEGYFTDDKEYFAKIVCSALPLLCIKLPYSKGPLRTSNVPAMLTDIPATISSVLNIDGKFSGIPVFEIAPNEERKRVFSYYDTMNRERDEFYRSMDEFHITGSVFDKASWRYSKRYRSSAKVSYNTKKIDFGTDEAFHFLNFGWGGNERNSKGNFTFNWGLGESSSIFLSLPKDEAVLLTANVLSPPSKKPQRMTTKIDGKLMGTGEFPRAGIFTEQRIYIGPDEHRQDVSTVEFLFSQHMTPEEGTRPLSVLFESITLSKLTLHEFGTTIQFGKGGNALSYIQKGWGGPANGYTWTNGKSASIRIPITIPDSPSITLRVNLRAFLCDGKVEKQTVIILVNGMRVGSWVITTSGFKDKRITIPKSFLTLPYLLDITFLTPNAVSPSTVGYNEDKRVLGVAVRTIDLYE